MKILRFNLSLRIYRPFMNYKIDYDIKKDNNVLFKCYSTEIILHIKVKLKR